MNGSACLVLTERSGCCHWHRCFSLHFKSERMSVSVIVIKKKSYGRELNKFTEITRNILYHDLSFGVNTQTYTSCTHLAFVWPESFMLEGNYGAIMCFESLLKMQHIHISRWNIHIKATIKDNGSTSARRNVQFSTFFVRVLGWWFLGTSWFDWILTHDYKIIWLYHDFFFFFY